MQTRRLLLSVHSLRRVVPSVERRMSLQTAAAKTELHVPVMKSEVLKYLDPREKQIIVDMTFGAGGHTLSLLRRCENVTLVCLDRDPVGYREAVQLSRSFPGRVVPLLGKFSELPDLLTSIGLKQNSIDGMLFDFGCSSMQFDTPGRGFSISKDGPLDMRMDGERFPDGPTAKDVLACSSEEDLIRIFKVYGDEKLSKKIARGVIESRYMFRSPETTGELADLVDSVTGKEVRFDKLNRPAHSATKVFQALRIFVNDELNEINQGMHVAQRYLKIGGVLVTIAFHSLEDTIVKRHLSGNIVDDAACALPLQYTNHLLTHDKDTVDDLLDTCWLPMTKHVVTPSSDEVDLNPRSRSARLRAARKIK